MIKKTKFYYLIEPLDIDGDKNNDGFLISQYKITKNNHKIFTKNKYMTFKAFNEFIKDFKHKSVLKFKGGNNVIPPQNQQIIVMTPEQYNNFMNSKGNIQNNNQIQTQQTPTVIVRETEQKSSFGSSIAQGFGFGAGFSFADNAVDALFNW
jgi:hypothetical protein